MLSPCSYVAYIYKKDQRAPVHVAPDHDKNNSKRQGGFPLISPGVAWMGVYPLNEVKPHIYIRA